METMYKTYRAEIKEVDEENGIIDMFIPLSTASLDRDEEVIEPGAFKKSLPAFKKRPILVSSHNYGDLRKILGEWKKIKITENGLEGSPQYYINQGNEEADWAFKLASKGMAAFSVAFIPKDFVDGEGDKEPRRTYKEAELLEISQVVVPSNPDAIQSVRSKSVEPVISKLCDDVVKLVTKPEETDDFIHIRVRDPADFQDGTFRTIDIDKAKGIKAVIGKLKGETSTTVQKYIFDKSKGWTMQSAQAWVKEHEKDFAKFYGEIMIEDLMEELELEIENAPALDLTDIPQPKEVSQEEIKDEFDYVKALIEKGDLNKENKDACWELVREIMRLSGSDIPVDIEAKIGAVLNQKNKSRLKDAQTLIQNVLDSAETTPEATPKSEEFTSEDLKLAIKEVFSEFGGK